MINYGCQNISESDIKAVERVLRSNLIAQGPCIEEFEKKLCDYTGAKYVSACNSATSALHLALKAIGIKKGDLVLTTPNTFVATSNSVLYCEGSVGFVDINKHTYNIDVKKLEDRIKSLKNKNITVKAVIAVHFAGNSCDMKTIYNLSKKYNFSIIEDASHALGSKYNDKMIGSCEYSAVTITSFHPVKMITTGEGGACFTNSNQLDKKIKRLRAHGIERRTTELPIHSDIKNYDQYELGYNYRMSDINAALGISQLGRLDYFTEKRNALAREYKINMENFEFVQLPSVEEESTCSFHLYVVRIKNGRRNLLYEKLKEKGVNPNIHYIPIYKFEYYKNLGYSEEYNEEMEKYYKECITLPLHTKLSKEDVKEISKIIEETVEYA